MASEHHTTDRWARAILIAFALVGLLHVPAFYFLVWENMTTTKDVLLAPPCQSPTGHAVR